MHLPSRRKLKTEEMSLETIECGSRGARENELIYSLGEAGKGVRFGRSLFTFHVARMHIYKFL